MDQRKNGNDVRYVLFTGAGGGLAKACIRELLRKDPSAVVFAADIDRKKLEELVTECGDRVIPLVTDITSDESLAEAERFVRSRTGKLRAVVNAAGIHSMGSLVEGEVTALAEKLMAVNLHGMVRVNRIFFPLIKAGNGRFVNFSSECGWEKAQPFNTPYAMSKYAVEAYTDGLRRELNFLGIKVIKIQPGSFRTGLLDQAEDGRKKLLENTEHYEEVLHALGPLMTKALEHAHDPAPLAKAVVKAVTARRPRLRYRVKTTWYLKLLDPLPDRLQDFGYRLVYRLRKRKD